MRIVLHCCLLLLIAPCIQAADKTVVYYPREQAGQGVESSYYLRLLTQVFEVTREQYGDYELKPSRDHYTQGRAVLSLQKAQGLDVLWTMTSRQREGQLAPVRIPLMKGLLGVRVLMVRQDQQSHFEAVRSRHDLAHHTALQGHDWPDLEILRSAGLRASAGLHYHELFAMLRKGRADYFPRGILEAWGELESLALDDLRVVPSLMITYRSPIYFFVNRQNTRLRQRIRDGLEKLRQSGAFDRLLEGFPGHRRALQTLREKNWRVLQLDNPLLPDQTPVEDESLWYRSGLFR